VVALSALQSAEDAFPPIFPWTFSQPVPTDIGLSPLQPKHSQPEGGRMIWAAAWEG